MIFSPPNHKNRTVVQPINLQYATFFMATRAGGGVLIRTYFTEILSRSYFGYSRLEHKTDMTRHT